MGLPASFGDVSGFLLVALSKGCLLELFWIGPVSSFWVVLDGVITNWSCLMSGLVRTYQTPALSGLRGGQFP